MAILLKARFEKVLRHKHPVRYAADYFFRWTVASIALLIPKFLDLVPLVIERNGYKLRIVATPFSVLLYRYPNYFREDETFIQTYLKEGDIYIDIGANIGTTTLAAAVSVSNTGHVHSFEPHPRTFRSLEKSISYNPLLKDRITGYKCALGDHQDIVSFTNMQADDLNHISDEGGVEVSLQTLDGILSGKVDRVALLKIDVEGYEKFVFEGASHILDITNAIYFENYEENFKEYDYEFDVVYDLLTSKDFSIYTLAGTSIDRLIDRTYRSMGRCENLLAVRNIDDARQRMGTGSV